MSYMSTLLWGFAYDAVYLEGNRPTAIAQRLILRREPYIAERGLHPFFDNRLTRGVYQQAYAKA